MEGHRTLLSKPRSLRSRLSCPRRDPAVPEPRRPKPRSSPPRPARAKAPTIVPASRGPSPLRGLTCAFGPTVSHHSYFFLNVRRPVGARQIAAGHISAMFWVRSVIDHVLRPAQCPLRRGRTVEIPEVG